MRKLGPECQLTFLVVTVADYVPGFSGSLLSLYLSVSGIIHSLERWAWSPENQTLQRKQIVSVNHLTSSPKLLWDLSYVSVTYCQAVQASGDYLINLKMFWPTSQIVFPLRFLSSSSKFAKLAKFFYFPICEQVTKRHLQFHCRSSWNYPHPTHKVCGPGSLMGNW